MASTPRRSGRAARAPERPARVADVLLELGVLAFAAWTVIYHICLYLHVPAVWAAVAEALAFRVDVACTFRGHPSSGALLAGAGWTRLRGVPGLSCWNAPA